MIGIDKGIPLKLVALIAAVEAATDALGDHSEMFAASPRMSRCKEQLRAAIEEARKP